jgi:hypothetical protein
MTSIFAYPLKNAWVIVGDRLQSDIHSTIRANTGFEVFPERMSKKIEVHKDWVLGFAGNTVNIKNIRDIFLQNIGKRIKFNAIYKIIRQLYTDLSVIDVSCVLINVKTLKAFKIVFSDMTNDKLSNYEVNSIEHAFIGSGIDRCRGTALLSQLNELKSEKITSRVEKFIRHSVNVLNNVSILDFQFTGSPYIYGCDIIICRKNNVRAYEIIPNGYLFRGYNSQWKIMKRV